jgi:hypothetical protein
MSDTDTAAARLAPCPFCGDPAPCLSGTEQYILCARCRSCGPQLPAPIEALAAWNRRAPDPRIARLIGRVEVVARKAREAGLVVVASELVEAATEAKAEPEEQSR